MGNYIDVEDVRKEGIPTEKTNDQINSRIVKWEAIVEQLTGQFFYELEPGELIFDGNDSRLLHFNVPLVEVTSLKINDETVALEADEYRAYVGTNPIQDDRRNPKIALTPLRNSVFSTHPGIFVKGLDQLVTAKWGFVESDSSTPEPIKAAVTKLVVLDIKDYFESLDEPRGVTPLRREKTDGHEIEYTQIANQQQFWAMMPNDIASVLALYRSPIKIDAPIVKRYNTDPGIQVVGF